MARASSEQALWKAAYGASFVGWGISVLALAEAQSPSAAIAPAGWYGDPYGVHRHRYWGGDRWTQHVIGHDGGQTIDTANPV